jgi:hypothetical protein
VSVEEPAAGEEAKDNEAKKTDEEEQKEVDDKMEDEGAEESKVETVDTAVPDEIKKEESADGKFNCCYMYHVSFRVYIKAHSLVSVCYIQK